MEGKLDLGRVRLVKESTEEQLKDVAYLEELTKRLGLNNENLAEQPEFVRDVSGGLFIWQYPNQFAKYLSLLGDFKISSYLEIGCRWGGTFIFTREFLKKRCGLERSVAIDLIDSPVKAYCDAQENCGFLKMDSLSDEFSNFMKVSSFDLILIDGNHDYHAVRSDYESCRDSGNVLVFHDIVNDACPGVGHLWNELKRDEAPNFEFHEITDQYPEVTARTGRNYLGIGVAVKKSFLRAANQT
jgi:cephalosporin hydroxylase